MPKEERTHGLELKGLDSEPTIEEIQEDLASTHKIKCQKAFKMTTKYRPLYLIITENDIKLKYLQDNIKYVCQTKISWEIHNNTKLMAQYHRCQEWGHATSSCFIAPRCTHCAGKHWTFQCTEKATKKCTNCNGIGHKAYSTVEDIENWLS